MISLARMLALALNFSLIFIDFDAVHELVAQDPIDVKGLYVGVGMGQDVGGIVGAKVSYWIAPFLSGFIGGGWAMVDGAYNTGIELRVPSKTKSSFFLTGMYGYNGAIKIKGKESLNGIYYGPTVGAGLILRQRYIPNYWRFSVNIPFRSQQMLDDWERIKDRRDIVVKQDLLPFTIGIGYHLAL